MAKSVGDLGKLIVAKGFKNLPKVQYIAQSGHTGRSDAEKGRKRQTGNDKMIGPPLCLVVEALTLQSLSHWFKSYYSTFTGSFRAKTACWRPACCWLG